MSTRDKRVEKAQTRVVFTVPFFAPAVAKLPVSFDKSVPTACTDGSGIVFGEDFFDGLKDQEIVTVLVHEAAHCLLGHLWRAPDACDWDIWNEATDHAVNNMLKEFGAKVTGNGLADPFPFPEPKDAYCADPKFSGMAEELIYRELSQNRTKQGGSQNPAGSGQSGGQSSQGGGQKGKTGQGGGNPAKGSMPSFGQIKKPQPGKSSDKKLSSDWSNTLVQCAKLAQGQGSLPASLERFVDATIHPQVPWWEILRSWLREQATEDWDFQKPDLTLEHTGFLMPSLSSERCGPIVFATDTSGSIDQEMLARFQSEKQNCLDEMRPRILVDIYCDARIQKVEEYRAGDEISKQAPGGGGTDFRPVFKHVAGMSEPVKAVVYLTDLYGSFPSADPGVPVIWVTWTKDGKAPFGEVVYGGN